MSANAKPPATAPNIAAVAIVAIYLTEHQLGERLQISSRTLQTWRSRGGGPPFRKMGGSVRYFWPDVEAWIAAQNQTSTSDTAENRHG